MEIYFNTAIFDKTKRDKKIRFEAQLSLKGDTMGLNRKWSGVSSEYIRLSKDQENSVKRGNRREESVSQCPARVDIGSSRSEK